MAPHLLSFEAVYLQLSKRRTWPCLWSVKLTNFSFDLYYKTRDTCMAHNFHKVMNKNPCLYQWFGTVGNLMSDDDKRKQQLMIAITRDFENIKKLVA